MDGIPAFDRKKLSGPYAHLIFLLYSFLCYKDFSQPDIRFPVWEQIIYIIIAYAPIFLGFINAPPVGSITFPNSVLSIIADAM